MIILDYVFPPGEVARAQRRLAAGLHTERYEQLLAAHDQWDKFVAAEPKSTFGICSCRTCCAGSWETVFPTHDYGEWVSMALMIHAHQGAIWHDADRSRDGSDFEPWPWGAATPAWWDPREGEAT